ncbi:UNVERIFIED_CONTAM: hypothetical protein NCL1_57799, partial [Trichonephila clavipes]
MLAWPLRCTSAGELPRVSSPAWRADAAPRLSGPAGRRAGVRSGQDHRYRRAGAPACACRAAGAGVQVRAGFSRPDGPAARQRCAGVPARPVDGRRGRVAASVVAGGGRGGSDPD